MITSRGHDDLGALAIAPDDEIDRTPRTTRRPRPRRRRPVVLATATCLVAVGVMAADWTAAVAATQRTDAAIHDSRADLAAAEDDLAAARASADARSTALADELVALDGSRVRRDDAAASAGAISGFDAGSPRLAALEDCLAGAAQALNQMSVQDTRVTITLESIEAACADAGLTL
jgi:hypothetical protein